MKKDEFIVAIAEKTGFTKKDVRAVLDAMQDVTIDAINEDKAVKLMNGITLTRVFKEAHPSRNPSTGETITVPAKYVPKCKIGKFLKDSVN